MVDITIIGLQCTGQAVSDGQSIKTRIITEELEKVVGIENVYQIDTCGWKKHPFKLFFQCIRAVQKSKNVIFMTDAGGIKVFPWLLQAANLAKKCKIHYVVIGGWLLHFPKKHKFITSFLKKLDGVYVETNAMKAGLEKEGFDNLYLMPNCKQLQMLTEDQMVFSEEEPFKLCTFSRVMKEKGIEDAIEAVATVNAHYGREVFHLDIYGLIDSEQTQWFDNLSATFAPEIKYRGIVPYNESVDVLKNYHALLFPTRFYTEGIPGTIIDAYAAGVPVVASEWESIADIVTSGQTGFSYSFEDTAALQHCLMQIAENPKMIHGLKKNCLQKAKEYLPENVLDVLVRNLR